MIRGICYWSYWRKGNISRRLEGQMTSPTVHGQVKGYLSCVYVAGRRKSPRRLRGQRENQTLYVYWKLSARMYNILIRPIWPFKLRKSAEYWPATWSLRLQFKSIEVIQPGINRRLIELAFHLRPISRPTRPQRPEADLLVLTYVMRLARQLQHHSRQGQWEPQG